jgi:small subunit ribosomal protein S19
MAEELVQKSKERFYRGIEVADLKQMDTREFAKLAPASARRAINRNYDVIEKFLQKCDRCTQRKKPIKTHNRSMIIVPKMIGKIIHVYNGKEFLKVDITEQMLGHRLGEFSLTRKIAKHTKAGVGATKGSMALKK